MEQLTSLTSLTHSLTHSKQSKAKQNLLKKLFRISKLETPLSTMASSPKRKLLSTIWELALLKKLNTVWLTLGPSCWKVHPKKWGKIWIRRRVGKLVVGPQPCTIAVAVTSMIVQPDEAGVMNVTFKKVTAVPENERERRHKIRGLVQGWIRSLS